MMVCLGRRPDVRALGCPAWVANWLALLFRITSVSPAINPNRIAYGAITGIASSPAASAILES
jgi:hypothetical protein